jgi:hypothetical protein
VVVVRVDAADLAAVPACPLVGAVRRGERRDAVLVGEPLDGGFDFVGVHDPAQVLVVTLIAGAEAARGMVAAVEAVTDADGGRSRAVGGDAVEEDLDLEPLLPHGLELVGCQQGVDGVAAGRVRDGARTAAEVDGMGPDDLREARDVRGADGNGEQG